MIKAVAAVIQDKEGRYLICRKGPHSSAPLLWEFPGGKVEPNETPEECLERELMEELKIEAKAGECIGEELLKRPGSDILILFHRATVVKGEPQLTEHSEILWAKPEELDSLEFTPPDKAMARKLLEPGPR